MESFSEVDRQSLIELSAHPGYKILLKLLEDEDSTLLELIYGAKNDEAVIRLTRYWQAIRHLRFVCLEPERVRDELKRERESLLPEPKRDPLARIASYTEIPEIEV